MRRPAPAELAIARARPPSEAGGAEIIDLIRLPLNTRPTPMVPLDFEDVSRCRDLDCPHYQRCLKFCATVRWKSFHCRQCPQRSAAVEAPSVRRGTAAPLLSLLPR